MLILLDNTVLSNFAVIHRVDLLRTALGEAATVPQADQLLGEMISAGYRSPITSLTQIR